MTAKDKYYIRVKNTLVEVTHEVYLVFYRFGRQERNQQEKEKRNHVISYDAWDTGERTGQELLPLPDEANVEELAIAAIMSEQLHRCLRLLPEAERKLIASHLVKAVTLTRGYGIQIDFNISEAQYLNGMEPTP